MWDCFWSLIMGVVETLSFAVVVYMFVPQGALTMVFSAAEENSSVSTSSTNRSKISTPCAG